MISQRSKLFVVFVTIFGATLSVVNGFVVGLQSLNCLHLCLYGILSIVLCGISALAYDIYHMCPPEVAYSFRDLLIIYAAKNLKSIVGYLNFKKFERQSCNVESVQKDVFLNLLHDTKGTIYGQKYRFDRVETYEDYKRLVPITRQADVIDYFERVAKGEQNVVRPEKPWYMALTTGTTGKNAAFLINRAIVSAFVNALTTIDYLSVVSWPNYRSLRKTLVISFSIEEGSTEAGITIAPATWGMSQGIPRWHKRQDVTPTIGTVKNEQSALYIRLVFGLLDKHIDRIYSGFAVTLYTVMVRLERQWCELVETIRTGKLGPSVDIELSVKLYIEKHLAPNEPRANELTVEFQKGFDGIVRRIWPHISYVNCVDSGSMAIYGEILRHRYLGGIPIYSSWYLCTEGAQGVNLWPSNPPPREYVLIMDSTFYEFLPVEESFDSNPTTYLAHQVEVGREYELMVTSLTGLYRYRVGDVLKVSRFYNQSPVFHYQYRIGQLLNLVNEKTTEVSVYETVTKTVNQWPEVTLRDYTCAVSAMVDIATNERAEKQHYIFFIELTYDSAVRSITQDEKMQMDMTLRHISELYETVREEEEIGPISVKIVKEGTFQNLRKFMLSSNPTASAMQFKTPRVLKKPELIQFIVDYVIG